ncbi:hypothetical protein LJC18_04990 [Lachnospiraceae bacterium OttesenSCG-928-E19]|nr:hypothetical protein [Lachnospiraceae bacterium OttesenSCG-928-E19]
MNKTEILNKIYKLIELHKSGMLGGEIMPEDENPGLDIACAENYIYFTLPMALNYQRNSYKLWEATNKSYNDLTVADVFNPMDVIKMSDDDLRTKLLKYKIALQPNKHIDIWKTISNTIVRDFDGDIRNLFIQNDYDIVKIKNYILSHKKNFPYLGGSKILNYWLYVIEQYTDAKFKNRDYITVAPDTHVIQSSEKLGLITAAESHNPNIRDELAMRWQKVLNNTDLSPIDVHTPMWLWSRGGFKQDI